MGSDKSHEERAAAGGDGPADAPVLAEGQIERLREMGRALGQEVPRRIVQLYLQDAPAKLAALRSTLSTGDGQAMEAAAHSLRGSSANLGALILAEHCNRLERLSGAAVPTEAKAWLEDLEAEYRRVEKAMRELLAELGACSE